MLAGRGEAAAAVAVDGRHSELVPALRPQVGQEHVFGESLRKMCPGGRTRETKTFCSCE